MKNLDTAFPFYDALLEQYRYRKGVSCVPFILCPTTNLVPWIIRRPHNAGDGDDITVWVTPCNGGTPIEIHGDDFGLLVTAGTSYDFIYYTGTSLPNPLPHNAGGYYLDVEDLTSNKHWYSETFGVRSSMTDYFYLEFKNDTERGNIAAYFIQGVWFDIDLVAPIYIREDTGEKRDGILVKEKQIKMKARVIRLQMAPEYLTDALIRLDMQDYVAYATGGTTSVVKQVIIKEPEFTQESLGLFAKMEIQLIWDIEIKKLNFKEMGYSYGNSSNGITKTGIGETTFHSGVYELPVAFEEVMPDGNYVPDVPICVTVALPGNPERPIIPLDLITANGFLIRTMVPCYVRWNAIWTQP